MFWHSFKYNILMLVRSREMIFWNLVFVILLGTFFELSFGKAYENSEMLSDIPVAVYIEDETVSNVFRNMIEDVSLNGDDKLLSVTYTDNMDDAGKLLADKDVTGVFYSESGELKLMINENLGSDEKIKTSILTNVVTDYHRIYMVASEADDSMEAAKLVAKLFSYDADNNREKKLTDGSMDMFVEYFYNLIAMGCLFASFTGIEIAIRGQANLSPLGARKCVARTGGFFAFLSELLAALLLLTLCDIIAMLYLTAIGVDFGNKLWQMGLLVLVGTLTGLTMGFLIGSVSRTGEDIKISCAVGISLTLCFLSGLMVGNMKFIVQKNCPWFNKINPAALISDSFYALNVYDTNQKFMTNIIMLLIMSAVFAGIGMVAGGRRSYASL